MTGASIREAIGQAAAAGAAQDSWARRATRRSLLLAGAAAVIAGAAAPVARAGAPDAITVYRDPGCGCCGAWADHLAAAGFAVSVVARTDMDAVKRAAGVPDDLASCHTALVAGYVLEGHVPATDVRRLLRDRPAVAGLAVPGMPVGSPGMEVPGQPADPYDVVAFDIAGRRTVFSAYRPADGAAPRR